MNPELIVLAVLAGAANWAFRVLPTRMSGSGRLPGGALGRFLEATGPAAITTLFAASLMPLVLPVPSAPLPLLSGLASVAALFAGTRSVVAATLGGALAYGAVFAVAGG